jgi:hypothetical protein
LRAYSQLLDPGGLMILVTPNVATFKNRLYGLIRKPGYPELRRFELGGVQFVSLGGVRNWFAVADFAIEGVRWVANRRFENVLRYGQEFLRSMFGAEIIVTGMRKGEVGVKKALSVRNNDSTIAAK